MLRQGLLGFKILQSKTVSSLSKETSTAVHQTSIASVALAKHMITERNYKYVLLGQFQSDAIEKRFGWYRQLSGANYFVSVWQVLEAEKSIRVKSLVKHSDMKIIDAASAMVQIESSENALTPIMEELLPILNSDDLLNEYDDVADKNITFYVGQSLVQPPSGDRRVTHACEGGAADSSRGTLERSRNKPQGMFPGPPSPRDTTGWQSPTQAEHLPKQTRGRSPSELPNPQQDRRHVGCAVATQMLTVEKNPGPVRKGWRRNKSEEKKERRRMRRAEGRRRKRKT